YWREKTFQTLALSALGAVLFIGAVEAVATLADAPVVAALNPYRTLGLILNPMSLNSSALVQAVVTSLLALAAKATLLVAICVLRVRKWNPSRSVYLQTDEQEAGSASRSRTRTVWDSPLIWREIRTLAYGRKVIVIKLAYLLIAAAAVALVAGSTSTGAAVLGMISVRGFAFVALALLALML